jgi:hypothetical protein
MCTQCLHHITPPTPFPRHLSSPIGTNPQDLFHHLVLQFCRRKNKEKEKKWHFCLLKIAIQGVSLWHFHVYLYYSPNWFISYIFLHFTLVPFLWLFQLV